MADDSKVLITIRSLVRIGNAQGITLPKDWIAVNHIKEGDKLVIRVEPVGNRKKGVRTK